MPSAIAIMTFRRAEVLRIFLPSVLECCQGCPVAVFEDCGQADETEVYLLAGATFVRRDETYEADIYKRSDGVEVYLGYRNCGISGQSNKAIRWFMEQTACDHLCLCNDDLLATGPFHDVYREAHKRHGVGLWCFCDLPGDSFRYQTVTHRGHEVKIHPRMTGAMMSMTRALVEKVGYFDAEAFNNGYGEEHCAWTNRARFAGFMNLGLQPQPTLDVRCEHLHHQLEARPSLSQEERDKGNRRGFEIINRLANRDSSTDPYRPYSTGGWPEFVGARDGVGIPLANLNGYTRILEPRVDPDLLPLTVS